MLSSLDSEYRILSHICAGMKLVKFHVSSTLAVFALVVAWETAVEANTGQGAAGANWYLRAPDGSRQGPYRLPQLGEWSSAGYVSLGGALGFSQL